MQGFFRMSEGKELADEAARRERRDQQIQEMILLMEENDKLSAQGEQDEHAELSSHQELFPPLVNMNINENISAEPAAETQEGSQAEPGRPRSLSGKYRPTSLLATTNLLDNVDNIDNLDLSSVPPPAPPRPRARSLAPPPPPPLSTITERRNARLRERRVSEGRKLEQEFDEREQNNRAAESQLPDHLTTSYSSASSNVRGRPVGDQRSSASRPRYSTRSASRSGRLRFKPKMFCHKCGRDPQLTDKNPRNCGGCGAEIKPAEERRNSFGVPSSSPSASSPGPASNTPGSGSNSKSLRRQGSVISGGEAVGSQMLNEAPSPPPRRPPPPPPQVPVRSCRPSLPTPIDAPLLRRRGSVAGLAPIFSSGSASGVSSLSGGSGQISSLPAPGFSSASGSAAFPVSGVGGFSAAFGSAGVSSLPAPDFSSLPAPGFSSAVVPAGPCSSRPTPPPLAIAPPSLADIRPYMPALPGEEGAPLIGPAGGFAYSMSRQNAETIGRMRYLTAYYRQHGRGPPASGPPEQGGYNLPD